jgi:hypothetical protein
MDFKEVGICNCPAMGFCVGSVEFSASHTRVSTSYVF